jgi:DNA-binding NtrC family response regulator
MAAEILSAPASPLIDGLLAVPLIAQALAATGLGIVALRDLETAALLNALEHCHGNRTHAARALGISVRTLQRKLKSLDRPASGD